jgi:hypothetical protein
MELVKFDLQHMENPEICGAQYQQGTLFGYELREYCAMCKSLILSEEPENSSRLVSKPVTPFCVRSW